MSDFKDAPQSITELRATKDGDGSKWTPRDLLVKLLRQIDQKKIVPTELIAVYRFGPPGHEKLQAEFAAQSDGNVILMLEDMIFQIRHNVLMPK